MNLPPFDGSNAAWALYAIHLCGVTYGDRPAKQIVETAAMLCGTSIDAAVRPVEGGVPAAMRLSGPDGMIAVFTGLTNVAQGLALTAAYSDLIVNRATRHFNSWVWNGATQLVRNLRLGFHGQHKPCYLFGHSAGGAIALAVAAALREINPDVDVHVVTFGSPRACTGSAIPLLGNVEITRWMNVGDDVPRLPPRYTDLTDVAFLTFATQLQLWARFVHTDGGLVIGRGGTVESRALPELERLLSTLTIPGSSLSTGEVFGNDHAVLEYERRLALLLPPIAFELAKPKPAKFLVSDLPALFQALTIDVGMSLDGRPVAGVEAPLANPPLAVLMERRTAAINSPIRRC